MAWYWWVLIVLVVLILLWLVLRGRSSGSAKSGSDSSSGSSATGTAGTPGTPGTESRGFAAAPADVDVAPADVDVAPADAAAGATDDEPYGPGSARAGADGSGPEGYLIKGNSSSMLYHAPGTRSYNVTKAEIWFRTEDEARAAGFSAPTNA